MLLHILRHSSFLPPSSPAFTFFTVSSPPWIRATLHPKSERKNTVWYVTVDPEKFLATPTPPYPVSTHNLSFLLWYNTTCIYSAVLYCITQAQRAGRGKASTHWDGSSSSSGIQTILRPQSVHSLTECVHFLKWKGTRESTVVWNLGHSLHTPPHTIHTNL